MNASKIENVNISLLENKAHSYIKTLVIKSGDKVAKAYIFNDDVQEINLCDVLGCIKLVKKSTINEINYINTRKGTPITKEETTQILAKLESQLTFIDGILNS